MTERTRGGELFINPLMTFYWAFRLGAVARRVLYLDAMRGTETCGDVSLVIRRFQASLREVRAWRGLPM